MKKVENKKKLKSFTNLKNCTRQLVTLVSGKNIAAPTPQLRTSAAAWCQWMQLLRVTHQNTRAGSEPHRVVRGYLHLAGQCLIPLLPSAPESVLKVRCAGRIILDRVGPPPCYSA